MASTPYAETEVLLAVMEDDEDQAEQLITSMTARERAELRHFGQRLISLVYQVQLKAGEVR